MSGDRRRPGRLLLALAPAVLVGCAAAPGGAAAAGSATRAGVVAPAPPVSAADFPLEPVGRAPRDGDGLIPNPATPTGVPPGPVAHCDETFDSAHGATSATVNRAIVRLENTITARYVLCLEGVFTSPLHVWSKWDPAMLVIEAAPGQRAALHLGAVTPADSSPNDHDGGDAGGVDVTDSRSVEVEGLDISGFHSDGPAEAAAGILVTVRQSGSTDQARTPHESVCFLRSPDHSCGQIYLIDDVVTDIANLADETDTVRADCDNEQVGAFGIAVLSYGDDAAHALDHVVIEGDTVERTRTGESETVTVNGDVTDFLEAHDLVADTDNIGMDAIGWEEGTDQARHGLIADNTVADVDTYGNYSYGRWSNGRCVNLPENAAGIYDDGGSYVWIDHNTVDETDQGISLDVETPRRETDHLLVTANTVVDGPGTSLGDPSTGVNGPGLPGASEVAGHAYEAFYVDSYGSGSSIEEVYAHGNRFENESEHYGATSVQEAPVVDVAGRWSHVVFYDNTIEGGGRADPDNPLLEIDNRPQPGGGDVIDCTDYGRLSTDRAGNGNFVPPDGNGFFSLARWRADNPWGYDAHSAVGATHCPAATP